MIACRQDKEGLSSTPLPQDHFYMIAVHYDRLSSYEAFLDDHEVAPHSKKPASLVGQPEVLASEVL